MKTYHVLSILALAFSIGCDAGGLLVDTASLAAVQCVNQAQVDRCHQISPTEQALCYDPGEVGPPPVQADGAWPAYECAAPPDGNITSGAPYYWFNQWCCGARACAPGVWADCTCLGGARGKQVCDGNGLHFGICVCQMT